MKKNKVMRLSSGLLVLTILTTCIISGRLRIALIDAEIAARNLKFTDISSRKGVHADSVMIREQLQRHILSAVGGQIAVSLILICEGCYYQTIWFSMLPALMRVEE